MLRRLPPVTRALQALLGGSADVALNPYEFAIQMAAEGQAVSLLLSSSLILCACLSSHQREPLRSGSVQDLRGRTIGVQGLGGARHHFLV